MTKSFAENRDTKKNLKKYYIMYDPTTVDLMGKIGVAGFTVEDTVEYLTGRKLEACNETN